MQWRILTLLFAGIIVIYLASLLQDSPYPHPAKMQIYDTTFVRSSPDASILSIQPDYVYQSMIYFGQSRRDQPSVGNNSYLILRVKKKKKKK